MVSFFQMSDPNRKIECKHALPEYRLLARLSVDLGKRLLLRQKSIPIISVDHWVSFFFFFKNATVLKPLLND